MGKDSTERTGGGKCRQQVEITLSRSSTVKGQRLESEVQSREAFRSEK